MCRIFGSFGGETSPDEMRAASLAQYTGGPDRQTHRIGGGWSLGTNRLSIVDIDGGMQPYVYRDVYVAFNGELYNHRSLRRDLEGRGYTFPDRCDGSVIPALYHEYGLGFVDVLEGMFAVAIIDMRAEPKLVLANDHAGMKSLYYKAPSANDTRLSFSSELPGLFAFNGVKPSIETLGLERYLATKTPFGSQTIFEGVRVMEPGTLITYSVSEGLSEAGRPRDPRKDFPVDAAAAALELRHLLADETRSLLDCDVPVCAITSGGLDSSFITALAARVHPELHTFNINYEGNWPGDESAFAREMSRAAGAIYHQVTLAPAEFPAMIGEVVSRLGQPNADPITLSTYALFRAVREAGFKVALTGDAADEIFGGYDRMISALGAPSQTWQDTYEESLAAISRPLRAQLYTTDYLDYVSEQSADESVLQSRVDDGTRLSKICAMEISRRLPAYHLRRVDHLSMANSVEARMPFCQPSVMALGRAIPDQWKIHSGRGKQTLYQAAEGIVPASILGRKKQPFTLPITEMLHRGSALMQMSEAVLTDTSSFAAGQLDRRRVATLLADQMDSPSDQRALAIWSLLIYRVWQSQVESSHGETHTVRQPSVVAA